MPIRRLLLSLLALLALLSIGVRCAHATTVNTCATATAGVDGSINACDPSPGATVNVWGAWVDASTLTPTTMVLGCAGSSLAPGAPTSLTGNTFGLPQCAANGGKVEWEPTTFWQLGGLVVDPAANTFVTIPGAVPVSPPAATVKAPDCYPPPLGAGVALKVTWSFAKSILDPAFIITWFCPGAGQNGWLEEGGFGYLSELPADWMQQISNLIASPKATIDAAVQVPLGAPDAELLPLYMAQKAATWPAAIPAPKTIGTTVYYVIEQPDSFVAVPVGTAPVGTTCDMTQSVNGKNGVPVASVTWFGTSHPHAVVAPCG